MNYPCTACLQNVVPNGSSNLPDGHLGFDHAVGAYLGSLKVFVSTPGARRLCALEYRQRMQSGCSRVEDCAEWVNARMDTANRMWKACIRAALAAMGK